MKRYRLLILLTLLLAGCVTVSEAEPTPNTLQLAATIAAQETLNAFYGNAVPGQPTPGAPPVVQPTLDPNQVAQATLVAGQLAATQTAIGLGATALAQNLQATGTVEAAATQAAVAAIQTNQALIQTQQALQAAADQQRIESQRREIVNRVMGWTIFLLILAFIALGGWAFWQFVRAEAINRAAQTESRPEPLVVWDRNGRRVVMNPDRRWWPVQVVDSRFQDAAAASAASAETSAGTAQAAAVSAAEAAIAAHTQPTPGPTFPTPPVQLPEIPATAPWRLIADDWQGGSLPLGMTMDGVVALDLEANPHLLVAGSPGSGKTRFCLLPLIATALADGWQVLFFDQNSENFDIFRDHANAHFVLISQNNPSDLVDYLRRLYSESLRRVDAAREFQVDDGSGEDNHRWDPRIGPRILAVIDNYETMIREMPTYLDRNELFSYTRLIAADAHRVGIHLVIVFQDPLVGEFDLRLRRSFTPILFKVRDSSVSRLLLNRPGAEELVPRQFVTVLNGGLYYALGFAPGEEEIASFLADRPQPPLPAPLWLSSGYAGPDQMESTGENL